MAKSGRSRLHSTAWLAAEVRHSAAHPPLLPQERDDVAVIQKCLQAISVLGLVEHQVCDLVPVAWVSMHGVCCHSRFPGLLVVLGCSSGV